MYFKIIPKQLLRHIIQLIEIATNFKITFYCHFLFCFKLIIKKKKKQKNECIYIYISLLTERFRFPKF